MLSAAAAARGNGQAPPQLTRIWRYKRWGLGRPIDEMSAREVKIMQTLDNVYETVRSYRTANNVTELAKRNPESWGVMVWLRTLESTDG